MEAIISRLRLIVLVSASVFGSLHCAEWTSETRWPGVARLSVESEPTGATVSIDGRVVGTTPKLAEVPFTKITSTRHYHPSVDVPGYTRTGAYFLGIGTGFGIIGGTVIGVVRNDNGLAGGIPLTICSVGMVAAGLALLIVSSTEDSYRYLPEAVHLTLSSPGYQSFTETIPVDESWLPRTWTLKVQTKEVFTDPVSETRRCSLVVNSFPLNASLFLAATDQRETGAYLGNAPLSLDCIVTRVGRSRNTVDSFGKVLSSVQELDYLLAFPRNPSLPKVVRRNAEIPILVGFGDQHALRLLVVDADDLLVTGVIEKTLIVSSDFDQAQREAAEAAAAQIRAAEEEARRREEALRRVESSRRSSAVAAALPKTETVSINGRPMTFVRDPSWTCTACIAACIATAERLGFCKAAGASLARAIGGWIGFAAGVATSAVCDQEAINKPCQSICCN